MLPKIDVYSIMRNEIKILPYFLRHYETFASRIFVWDDDSDDGTREILDAHPQVTILELPFHGADDVQYVKQIWPQYSKYSNGIADWCMCVDADEFVYCPNLVEKLEELGKAGVKKIRCEGYTMHSSTFPTTNNQIYDEIKMGWPDCWSKKDVVFTPDITMSWTPGRHGCVPLRHHPTAKHVGIKLLHFRYMGPEYFLARDKKNCDSMRISFNDKKRGNLPDGTRGMRYEWYENQKDKLMRVVE